MVVNNAKKFFLALLFLILINVLYLSIPGKKKPNPVYYAPDSIECFYSKEGTLPDISLANPAKDKSIFFHETSCSSGRNGKIVITARQACAVESAAKLNPNFEIYLLYTSPGLIIDEGTESDRFIEALLSYKNVKIHHLDYGLYVKNTLVEDLYKEGKIQKSTYATSHASDVLRYLTLWKYGGIYLDLDVVVIKSLEDIPLNFAGAESIQTVGSSVLGFEHLGVGHNLTTECLKDLQRNFNGQQWAYNGPGVITRLAQRVCGTHEFSDIIECMDNFTVYPTEFFYPIYYKVWEKFFSEGAWDEVNNVIKESYMVHIWNKLSYKAKLSVHANVPYIQLAREYCPKVFSQCKRYF